MSRHRYRKRGSYRRGRYRARRSYGKPRSKHRRSRPRNRYYSRNHYYPRSRPRRRNKYRSRRSSSSPAETAELLANVLSMPNEVLAALAAGVLSGFGVVVLAVLKVALWIVCVTAVVVFTVLMIAGMVVLAQQSARHRTRNSETTTEHQHGSAERKQPVNGDDDQILL